jgi:hypothetical protein
MNYIALIMLVLGFRLWFLLVLDFFNATWIICYINKLALSLIVIFKEYVFYSGNVMLL